jgi:hypothetical protein
MIIIPDVTLSAFANFQKHTSYFVLPFRLSIRTEKLGSFLEIFLFVCLQVFLKNAKKCQDGYNWRKVRGS